MKHFYFLFFLILSELLSAQNLRRNFTTEDGLPASDVYMTFEDSRGFIWFATENGACCYDGHRFKNYSIGEGLPDNVVLGMAEDNAGRLWFSTLTGPPSFLYKGKIFRAKVDALAKKEFIRTLWSNNGKAFYSTLHGIFAQHEDSLHFIFLTSSEKKSLDIAATDQLSNAWLKADSGYVITNFSGKISAITGYGNKSKSFCNDFVSHANYSDLTKVYGIHQQKIIVKDSAKDFYTSRQKNISDRLK